MTHTRLGKLNGYFGYLHNFACDKPAFHLKMSENAGLVGINVLMDAGLVGIN